jgi:hypothetical protein
MTGKMIDPFGIFLDGEKFKYQLLPMQKKKKEEEEV